MVRLWSGILSEIDPCCRIAWYEIGKRIGHRVFNEINGFGPFHAFSLCYRCLMRRISLPEQPSCGRPKAKKENDLQGSHGLINTTPFSALGQYLTRPLNVSHN